MKKISTVAAKQGRKASEQKLTVGLDLGDRSDGRVATVATRREEKQKTLSNKNEST